MQSFFYSHLVDLDSLIIALSELDITMEEKQKLEKLAHDQLHNAIVDVILNELAERDKKIFLANLRYETQEKIWKHLNEKVDKIEDKIFKAALDLKNELHKDISEVNKI